MWKIMYVFSHLLFHILEIDLLQHQYLLVEAPHHPENDSVAPETQLLLDLELSQSISAFHYK